MKQFLILLSSIITLTISNNTFANFKQNTTFTNNLQTNNNNDNQNSLFNNQYGYLSDSDWITNQSIADHKFYSYDSKHADYQLSSGINARNAFFVDADGKLQYDSKLVLEKDKVNIENTKQEMFDDKKITIIKDDYNPYSKSEYSKSYFSCDKTDWQYIQLGGVEKHIDISQQAGANKVDITNLSEALGLYYIAKAAHKNKISQAVAHNLGIYFISQSSLKEKINNKSVIKIIDLITDNNEIYKLIFNDKEDKNKPVFTNNDKNNSLNLIFDNDNNLIKIYYNEFDKSNINNNLNYYWSDSYSWWSNDNSETYKIFKWTEYSKNWDEFLKIYPTFKFNQSILSLSGGSQTHSENVSESFSNSSNTNKIVNNQGSGNTNSLYHLNIYMGHDTSQYPVDGYANLDLNIWHDNENIYFKWFFTRSGDGTATISIKLDNINFINIMN